MTERGPGPQSQKIVREEGEWLAPGIQRLATLAGIAMSAGQGCVLEDADGREYLDFMAGVGVASLGHSHPRWTSAISAQASKLTVGSFASETRLDWTLFAIFNARSIIAFSIIVRVS